ncbi:DUF6650 family protein [Paraburkholderia sp. A1RO-5L]|uniref:DUF6650 family protein n=1 Tax=unclassified Paraburkholderia TaxID=2615204 RepID=UPI003B9824A8
MLKRPFQWLRENFTGVSTPLVGVSWQSTTSEKEAIRKLLVFLDDRRVLHVDEKGDASHLASHVQSPEWLAASILEMR